MELAIIALVLGFLGVPRMVSGRTYVGNCMLTRGYKVNALAVRILLKGETLELGVLVTRNRLLTNFSPFVSVAQDSSRLTLYEFIAYDKNHEGDYCYQESKATGIIPPPGWSRLGLDQVRNAALWKFDSSSNPFNVSENFPFLFPENGDYSKLSKAVSETRIGDECDIQWVTEVFDETTSTLRLFRWVDEGTRIAVMKRCQEAFCQAGVCKLGGVYDYCALDEARTKKDAKEQQGGFLICHGTPIAALNREGEKGASKGMVLFISLLDTWKEFEKHKNDNDTLTTVVAPTKGTATVSQSSITGTKETTAKDDVTATQRICHCYRRTRKRGSGQRNSETHHNDIDDDDDDDDGARMVTPATIVLALCATVLYEIR